MRPVFPQLVGSILAQHGPACQVRLTLTVSNARGLMRCPCMCAVLHCGDGWHWVHRREVSTRVRWQRTEAQHTSFFLGCNGDLYIAMHAQQTLTRCGGCCHCRGTNSLQTALIDANILSKRITVLQTLFPGIAVHSGASWR